jgi:GNAT superfamily N-acetyltransferase
VRVTPTRPAHFPALAGLQHLAFPDLAGDEAFTEAMYASHTAIFPGGQLAAVIDTPDGEVCIGSTVTMRTNHDFEDGAPGYYFDFIGRGYLTTHDPHGAWLYGIDMSVHPDYRGRGVGSMLYAARHNLVRRLNLRGELVAGLLPGYAAHRDSLSVDEYARRVVAGDLRDPTLSMQLKNGFTVRKLLHGYVHYPACDDVCTLLVRENAEYRVLNTFSL